MHFMQILSVTQCLESDYSTHVLRTCYILSMQISLSHSIPKGNSGLAFLQKNITGQENTCSKPGLEHLKYHQLPRPA